MSVPFTIQLDPAAIAPDRTMLDLNDGATRTASIDWGDADVTAYQTQEGQYGNAVADFILPNRTITIQLGLGMDDGAGGVSQEQARAMLQQKVGLLQREGGQLLRQRSIADPAMYADIVRAVLTPNDVWGETGNVELWTLVLETLPDFYGDEITLDSITATGHCASVLKASGVAAGIGGDYPPRCRIVVADTSGHDQHGLLWGLRSRHYDAAATAALFYEAEALTPLNGATVSASSLTSGGDWVALVSPPVNTWVPMLSTAILSSGDALTHQGSYRVWARVLSDVADTQFRLLWGVGSLAVPVTNDAVTIPGDGLLHLEDLGTIRLDAPPVGGSQWHGVVQTLATGAATTTGIDCIYLQPLDESAGQLSSVSIPSAASISAIGSASTAVNDPAIAGITWVNPDNVFVLDANWASATPSSGGVSEYLKGTGFGFALAAGATIEGIQVDIYYQLTNTATFDVKLAKAGVVQSGAWTASAPLGVFGSDTVTSFGGPTDLWGTTWTPTDVNAAGFGCAVTCADHSTGSAMAINFYRITVYYTLGSGFTVAQDAVLYADQAAELRHDGMFRTPDGTVYGPVSKVTGDLPRLPPSALEGRPVELFVKPSRGDLDAQPDANLDGLTVQVKYRPCYLGRP